MPKEHGSWSLALEPVALALLVAPSVAGFGLAMAVVAGFFARRPLRLAWSDARAERRIVARQALFTCVAAALIGLGIAVSSGGADWLIWLGPVAVAGMVFAYFDTKGEGRAEVAEIAGSAAFAGLPAAFAVLGGWSALAAVALGFVMLARSVPSVLYVRAFLRGRKTGVHHNAPALILAILALVGALLWNRAGLVPALGVVFLALLLARALSVLVIFRPNWRASRVGMMEAVLGFVYVVGLAGAWRV